MEKNIKDYLHLYLGCKIYIPSIEDDIEMWEDYQLLAVSQHDCTIVHPENGISSFPKEDIKPILRPLSDMTDEESREVQNLMIEYACLSFTHEQMHGNRVGNGKSFYYAEFDDEGNLMCTVTSPIQNLPLKVVPFLLSKHFDLFGLIPNVAIDKTTLKSNL